MRRLALGVCTLALLAAVIALLLPEDGSEQEFAQAKDPAAPSAPAVDPGQADPAADDDDESTDAATADGAKRADRAPAAKAPSKLRRAPLPKTAEGKIDFAALGLTGKESGAELLMTEETVRTAPVRMAWSVGDEWVVESYYRQTQAAGGEIWTGPTRWQFRVDRETLVGNVPGLLVEVTLQDEAGERDSSFPASTFTVSRDGRLLHADLYHVRAGKGKLTRVAYENTDGPVAVAGTIVPFELPPGGVNGRLVGDVRLPTLDPVSEASRRRFPQPAELLGHGEDRIEVTFRSPTDGTRIRQEWAQGDMRWPVVSETEHRRSYRRR